MNATTSFWDKLKELDMFYNKDDAVHQTMRRVVKRLEDAGLSYAVMGGMAVFYQGHRRATNDLDLLMTAIGLEEFRKRFVPIQYGPCEGRSRRFVDNESGITIDILVAGRYPGSGKPGPVVFPDPLEASSVIEEIRFLDVPSLIQLKLAARRHQDFADVVNLIRIHDLDESFQSRLHDSLHRDYIECLEEKRREAEYESRE